MYQKTYPPTPPLSTRAEVEMITAANARHAAALPLDRLAEAIEAVAADINRLADKLPAAGEP